MNSSNHAVYEAFARRFNLALNIYGAPEKNHGRQIFVANLFDVSRPAAGKWLEGRGMPRPNRIPDIAKELGVRAAWLEHGEGPMLLSDEQVDLGANVIPVNNALLLKVMEFITLYINDEFNNLNAERKASIIYDLSVLFSDPVEAAINPRTVCKLLHVNMQ